MLILNITKAELKERWKGMYQWRKEFSPDGNQPDELTYGYFTGKMEYTAWLLLNTVTAKPNETP